MLLPNHKYALIVLPVGVAEDVPTELQLGDGLWATRQVSLEVPEHLKGWIGSVMAEEIRKGDLYLWATRPTKNPELIDQESSQLHERVMMTLFGLMIASPRLALSRRALVLSGARFEDEIDVRQVGTLDALIKCEGVPWPEVSSAELAEAAAIGAVLSTINGGPEYRRLRSAFACYRVGLEAIPPPVRIHQFVRCVEGLVLPEKSKTESQFVNRTELFLGPRYHALARQLFMLRSAEEHLHDAIDAVGAPTRREGALELWRAAHVAQAIARNGLHRIFTEPGLLEIFQTDQTLRQFWLQGEPARRKHWGEPLDVKSVMTEFEEDLVRWN